MKIALEIAAQIASVNEVTIAYIPVVKLRKHD